MVRLHCCDYGDFHLFHSSLAYLTKASHIATALLPQAIRMAQLCSLRTLYRRSGREFGNRHRDERVSTSEVKVKKILTAAAHPYSDWLRLCAYDDSLDLPTQNEMDGLSSDCNAAWRKQIAYDVAYVLAVGIFGVGCLHSSTPLY